MTMEIGKKTYFRSWAKPYLFLDIVNNKMLLTNLNKYHIFVLNKKTIVYDYIEWQKIYKWKDDFYGKQNNDDWPLWINNGASIF